MQTGSRQICSRQTGSGQTCRQAVDMHADRQQAGMWQADMHTYSRHTCKQAVSRLADRQQAVGRQAADRHADRQQADMYQQICRQADIRTFRHADRQQTNMQIGSKQKCRQVDRRADRKQARLWMGIFWRVFPNRQGDIENTLDNTLDNKHNRSYSYTNGFCTYLFPVDFKSRQKTLIIVVYPCTGVRTYVSQEHSKHFNSYIDMLRITITLQANRKQLQQVCKRTENQCHSPSGVHRVGRTDQVVA